MENKMPDGKPFKPPIRLMKTTIINPGIEQVLVKFFEVRDTLHMTHLGAWKNRYASHLHLEEAYEGILDLADRFVEFHFGKYGVLHLKTGGGQYTEDIVEYVESCQQYFNNARVLFKEGALQQILDDVEELFGKLLYKLRELPA